MSGLLVAGKIQTLLDRLTATRAGYLDAAITSRASAANLTTLSSDVATVDANVDAIKVVTDTQIPPVSIVGVGGGQLASVGNAADSLAAAGDVACGAVQNTWYTVTTYSGSGVVFYASVYANEALTANYQTRLLVDGTQVLISDSNAWASGDSTNDGLVLVGTYDATAGTASVAVPFSSSFSIQVRCTSTNSAKNFNSKRYYIATS